jgi:hypothetical protein
LRETIAMLARRTLLAGLFATLAVMVMGAFPMTASAAKKKGKGDRAGFKLFDLNTDLHLSPAEYKTMAETKGQKYAGPFKKVDADGNGLISIDEYRAALKRPNGPKKKQSK